MRIDKFLKVSRIIKRRTIAAQACDGGRVKINDKPAKPSSEVKIGDVIAISFGEKRTSYVVQNINENVRVAEAPMMYTIAE